MGPGNGTLQQSMLSVKKTNSFSVLFRDTAVLELLAGLAKAKDHGLAFSPTLFADSSTSAHIPPLAAPDLSTMNRHCFAF